MTRSIHIVAHKTTDAVLAAYTRGDTDAPDALASVVGDKLTVYQTVDKAVNELRTFGSFNIAELVGARAPGSTELTENSVLDTPLAYRVVRDQQGQVQSVERGQLVSNVTVSGLQPNLTISVEFPARIELTGRSAVMRFATDTAVHEARGTFMPTNNELTKGSASISVPKGQYRLLLLVQGFGATIEDSVTVP